MPKLLVDPSFLQSVNVSILPRSDNAYDLGSSSYRWKDGWFAGNVTIGGYGNLGSLQIGGTEIIDSSRVLKNIASIAQSLLPQSSGNYDLGSDDKRWRDIYVYSRIVFPNQNIEAYSDYLRVCFPDELTFDPLYIYKEYIKTMNIIPLNDEIYNLGSSDYKWYNAYISNIFTQYIESGKLSPGTTFLLAQPVDADSNNTLRDSPDLILRAKYWDSANAVSKNIDLGFRHIAEAEGVSRLGILFDGTEKLSVKNNGSITVYGSILPNADNSVDLGSSSYKWRHGYFRGRLYISGTGDLEWSIHSNGEHLEIREPEDGDKVWFKMEDGAGIHFYPDGTQVLSILTGQIKAYKNILPSSDNAIDLGSSSLRWKKLYCIQAEISNNKDQDAIIIKSAGSSEDETPAIRFINTSDPNYQTRIKGSVWGTDFWYTDDGGSSWNLILTISDIVDVYTNIEPASDGAYNLGSSSYRWKNLYAINIYAGDINLNNGWKVTELPDGLVVKDPSGEEIFKITKDGIWFKGKKIGE